MRAAGRDLGGTAAAAAAGGHGDQRAADRGHAGLRVQRPRGRGRRGRAARPRHGLSRAAAVRGGRRCRCRRPPVRDREGTVPGGGRAAPGRARAAPRRTAPTPRRSCSAARSWSRTTTFPRPRSTSGAPTDQMAAARFLEAQAALEQAQINLGYTEIQAPIAGRIGRADVQRRQSGRARQRRARDHRQPGPDLRHLPGQPAPAPGSAAAAKQRRPPVVRVTLAGRHARTSIRASSNFLDVQVDPGTDTVTVRAELPNPERILVDGQFVGVRVERERARAGARGAAGGAADRPGRPLRPGGRRRRQGGGAARRARRSSRARRWWSRAA